MAAVISFFRPAATTAGAWSQQELAEFYRVEAALIRAGMRITSEQGVSDEADPWFVFCRPDGDAIMHFARIDGSYVVASEVLDRPMRGADFRALLDEIAARNPALLPMPQAGAGTKLVVHPAALLAAIVAAAALILSSKDAAAGELDAIGPEGSLPAMPDGGAPAAVSAETPQGKPSDDSRSDDHRRQVEAILFTAMIFAAQSVAADELDRRSGPDLLSAEPTSAPKQNAAQGEAPPPGAQAGSARAEAGTIQPASALDADLANRRGEDAPATPERPGAIQQGRPDAGSEGPAHPKLAAATKPVAGEADEHTASRSTEPSLLVGVGRLPANDARPADTADTSAVPDGKAAKAGSASVSPDDSGSNDAKSGAAQSGSQGNSPQTPWLVSVLRSDDERSGSSSGRGKAAQDETAKGETVKADKLKADKSQDAKSQDDKSHIDDLKGSGSGPSGEERAESGNSGSSKAAAAGTSPAIAEGKAAEPSHTGPSAAAPGQNKKAEAPGAEPAKAAEPDQPSAGSHGAKADVAAGGAEAEASQGPANATAPGQIKQAEKAAAQAEAAKSTGSEKQAVEGQGSTPEAAPAAEPGVIEPGKHPNKAADPAGPDKVTGQDKHAADGHASAPEAASHPVKASDVGPAAASAAAPGQQAKHPDKAADPSDPVKSTGPDKLAVDGHDAKADAAAAKHAPTPAEAEPGQPAPTQSDASAAHGKAAPHSAHQAASIQPADATETHPSPPPGGTTPSPTSVPDARAPDPQPAPPPTVETRPVGLAATVDADGNLVFAPGNGSKVHPSPGHPAPPHAPEMDPHADVGLVGLSHLHAPLHHPDVH
ncbi:hypothetical protein U8607_05630 [Methylobacterium durans]|uniref:hypothetical protein n=1 Tax=Methylobacterium durans TaxID=2202825 RepID=UPI002B000CA8|nr:hypothetical protein [Methylobacterium durans]MEA1831560.1 hypothetical protein [Methylobacterium durans]